MLGKHIGALIAGTATVAAVSAAVVLGVHHEGDQGSGVSPGRTEAPVLSPFTGLPGGTGRPVLAVKIDNSSQARPHTGLSQADIVYVEPVEGGLSRLLAVFSTRLPRTVGPVRSARESDLELLRQYGHPALAFSGAQTRLLPLIASAPVYGVSPRYAPAAYSRGGDRAAPHNLYARPDRLLAQAPKASAARDIGFRFGTAPSGGRPTTVYTVRYGAFTIGFRWSAADGKWRISMDGAPLLAAGSSRPAPATVVIQYVTVRSSAFKDRLGAVSPYTVTTGSGRALVLRDGAAYDARWSRPSAGQGTGFTLPSGEAMRFAPGQVWVVLAAR